MRFLDFGSVNIDHVYHLDHLVRAGETVASSRYEKNAGGKGFNQAVALARAGQSVHFAGAVGADGVFLKEHLETLGVDTTFLSVLDVPTGHAVIQVDANAQNAILLFGGANRCITEEKVSAVLRAFSPGDVVLLQNEISSGENILREAAARGLTVVLNPSPVTPELRRWPLELVSVFLLNEVEAGDLTGETEPEAMLAALQRRFPKSMIVLTLGENGSYCAYRGKTVRQNAVPAHAVDTTAAGDTFTGYFLHTLFSGGSVESALRRASFASALAVSRRGAAPSIPESSEVAAAMERNSVF